MKKKRMWLVFLAVMTFFIILLFNNKTSGANDTTTCKTCKTVYTADYCKEHIEISEFGHSAFCPKCVEEGKGKTKDTRISNHTGDDDDARNEKIVSYCKFCQERLKQIDPEIYNKYLNNGTIKKATPMSTPTPAPEEIPIPTQTEPVMESAYWYWETDVEPQEYWHSFSNLGSGYSHKAGTYTKEIAIQKGYDYYCDLCEDPTATPPGGDLNMYMVECEWDWNGSPTKGKWIHVEYDPYDARERIVGPHDPGTRTKAARHKYTEYGYVYCDLCEKNAPPPSREIPTLEKKIFEEVWSEELKAYIHKNNEGQHEPGNYTMDNSIYCGDDWYCNLCEGESSSVDSDTPSTSDYIENDDSDACERCNGKMKYEQAGTGSHLYHELYCTSCNAGKGVYYKCTFGDDGLDPKCECGRQNPNPIARNTENNGGNTNENSGGEDTGSKDNECPKCGKDEWEYTILTNLSYAHYQVCKNCGYGEGLLWRCSYGTGIKCRCGRDKPGANLDLTGRRTEAGTQGASISADEGVIPENTEITVKKIVGGEVYNRIYTKIKDESVAFEVYKIELEADGEKVTPNGTVQMTIDLPEGYVKDKISVYGLSENDEDIEVCNPIVINGKIIFQVDKISYIAVSTTKVNDKDTTGTLTNPNAQDIVPTEEKKETTFPIGMFIVIACIISAIIIFFIVKTLRVKVKIIDK